MPLEKLLQEQKTYISLIETATKNYKKTAHAKRTKGFITARQKHLEELWQSFVNNHLEIDKLISSFTKEQISQIPYLSQDLFLATEEKYYDFAGILNDALESFNPVPSQSSTNNQSQCVSLSSQSYLKLPKISLPKFSGSYDEWRSFSDLFISLVHNNNSISSVQKLHYLKASVTGEAEHLLRHYQITESNYLPAWKTLQDRYQNTRVLVNTQLKLLFNQTTVNSESARGVKSLIDQTSECLCELQALNISTSNWDPILIHLITQKLPSETRKLWEEKLGSTQDLPSFKTFKEFLESRFRTLEALNDTKSNKSFTHHTTTLSACTFCKEAHATYRCPKFLNSDINTRYQLVNSKRLCVNCLSNSHNIYKCTSKYTCHKCNKRHHTLLHKNQTQSRESLTKRNFRETENSPNNMTDSNKPKVSTQTFFTNKSTNSVALLSTALVNIISKSGVKMTFRALIDSGAQTSFITENAARKIQQKRIPTNMTISGLGNSNPMSIKFSTNCTMITRTGKKLCINTLIVPKITDLLPPNKIDTKHLKHIKNLDLADPTFHLPGKIDILLGADAYGEILLPGIKKGPPGTPTAQNSVLGWILIGGSSKSIQHNISTFTIQTHDEEDVLNKQLKQFWESEEVFPSHSYSRDEQECESMYLSTTRRTSDGRYEVRLPFKTKTPSFGNSYNLALKRFFNLEKKFQKDINLYNEYKKCIQEYLALGHMKPIVNDSKQNNSYYLPHHAVFKDSTTTKLRVVFDASAPSTNGLSLNDQLHAGPVLQRDIFSIVLHWRQFKYAMTADIEKMYRMINMHDQDQNYHKILWRNSQNEEITTYKLTTVTFGTTSAPYLAIRTLHQLADDEKTNFPQAAEIIKTQFYVDDALLGAHSINEALELQNQLILLLQSGGFNLRKWVSNTPELLENIPDDMRELNLPLTVANDDTIKALGIVWHPATDYFTIQCRDMPDRLPTKRNILSDIAKLYDPLGWISPIIITAKVLMQQLWLSGCSWDDPVPTHISTQWQNFKIDLPHISNIKIPRWICIHPTNKSVQLHGFSDASMTAYSAAVYIRIVTSDNNIVTRLITAKSKVAPVKQVSLPRLELCGALLLAKLLRRVKNDLNFPNAKTFAWTDSTITLCWVQGHPAKYKTYVANRVTQIQEILSPEQWHHISTTSNPADYNCRGTKASLLKTNNLWWYGPTWLQQTEDQWPMNTPVQIKCNKHLELKKCFNIIIDNEINEYLNQFSSLFKLLRVTAYCLRFINNAKKACTKFNYKFLTAQELLNAKKVIIKTVQHSTFHQEINQLKKNLPISSKSHLLSLNPFLDSDTILRVGGRLKHSNIPYNQKHPMILPKSPNHLTKLIIKHYHHVTLHGGVELVLNAIRNEYWLCNSRNSIRQQLHNCITCFKARPKCQNQLMANLPASRCNIARPFQKTGVDYAGPIPIKLSKHKTSRTYKGYICIFVCMSTKAIHLEPVSDMTTSAFIAAFKRFVSRRGLVTDCYSDCGTNFVGANKVLSNELTAAIKESVPEIAEQLAMCGTEWHFNPPSAPHFGGLWEAGVKSVKYHLIRVIKNSILTYEELHTLLSQIEACLNSRPLYPMTDDPDDVTVLTPGHFLIGDSLLQPPEPVIDTAMSIRSRWQHIQMLQQHFWTQWSKQYLTQLQNRPKWHNIKSNPKEGDLVLIKNENLPPCKWAIGRIIQLHPGSDNLTRVVTLKTQNNIIKRPLTKLCILPYEQNT